MNAEMKSWRWVFLCLYIERKAGNVTGPARIGRVIFSQTGRTLYYRDQKFQRLKNDVRSAVSRAEGEVT